MAVKIRLHGRIRELVGSEEIVINEKVKTLRDVLEKFITILGDKAKEVLLKPEDVLHPRSRVVVLVNGFSVKMLGSLDYPVKELDEVRIDHIDVMEFIGGG